MNAGKRTITVYDWFAESRLKDFQLFVLILIIQNTFLIKSSSK